MLVSVIVISGFAALAGRASALDAGVGKLPKLGYNSTSGCLLYISCFNLFVSLQCLRMQL
jgi:hypothetical protein